MATYWITDAELLALSLAAVALAEITSTERDTHRETATALVRSVIEVRFDTEGWTPGGDVKAAVAAIAADSLLARRGYNPAAAGATVRARAAWAWTWLDLVRDGKALPEGWDGLTDRRGALVAGTDGSAWEAWRTGGSSDGC